MEEIQEMVKEERDFAV